MGSKKQKKRKDKSSQVEQEIVSKTEKKRKKSDVDKIAKKSSSKNKKKQKSQKNDTDPYSHLDAATAAAMRKDDEEIASLEAKMGLGSEKEKTRLYKEYAKIECYGDDFGNFLEDVDTMVNRVVLGEDDDNYEEYQNLYGLGGDGSSDDDSGCDAAKYLGLNGEPSENDEDEDEMVPMKDAASDEDVGGDFYSDEDKMNVSGRDSHDIKNNREERKGREENLEAEGNSRDDESDSDSSDKDKAKAELDHKPQDTYRPTTGEDIYGNPLIIDSSQVKPKKYVPPHLRKKQEQQSTNNCDDSDEMDQKAKKEEESKKKMISRSLNNALNRLSEDTLVSVSQAIAQLYQTNPTSTVNECLWKNLRVACIERPHLMTGLIPVYVASIAGVHIQLGDTAQLGEFVLEMTVTELWNEIQTNKDTTPTEAQLGEDDAAVSKEASNLLLVVCYLYNYGIVHCSLLYSVIRSFIDSFRELEVELLLLILSHCGRALRSDDPLALKEIIILVQKRALQIQKGDNSKSTETPLSSRVEYMVAAMMDLKNNKRRTKDTVYAEKVSKIRKLLGQVKKTSSAFRSSDSPSLRIGLDDILNVETKGRWWKVGASWVGNQYRFSEDGASDLGTDNKDNDSEQQSSTSKEDAKLLKLAAKARMNTDAKRAIFCIIMKSADCEDAFEKLTRAGYLKNRKERDTVRVLMECCGNEKSYNPFYAHLAARCCEYQQQCRFSMQLAFWDMFKHFDNGNSVSIRRAANLSKLLYHLVVVQPVMKLGVIKVLDLGSPDELSEPAMIFLTIFFSNLLEYFDDPTDLKRFLENEVKKSSRHSGHDDADDIGAFDPDEDIIGGDGNGDDEGLGPSISIFLLQTLKSSPKYKKGSKFRKNLKAAVKACDTDDFFF